MNLISIKVALGILLETAQGDNPEEPPIVAG
jgi:hypothetical protein